MDKSQLKVLVNSLGLPDGEYVLFGGSCLTIRDLRKLEDVDIFVSDKLYRKLARIGWLEKCEEGGAPYLTRELSGITIDVIAKWRGGIWQPDIDRYLSDPEIIESLPFMPLKDLYQWKKATRRPRDIEDMILIEKYWAA